MILVDSDVFLIDLRYQRDQRFGDNRAFLECPPLSRHFRGRTEVDVREPPAAL